jgi:hypothetical protein
VAARPGPVRTNGREPAGVLSLIGRLTSTGSHFYYGAGTASDPPEEADHG